MSARPARLSRLLLIVSAAACASSCATATPAPSWADGTHSAAPGASPAQPPPAVANPGPAGSGPPSAAAVRVSASPAPSTPKPPAAPKPPSSGNPLAGRKLYVEPDTEAAKQVRTWRAQGRTDDARQMQKIADRPIASWITNDPAEVTNAVDSVVGAAAAKHRLPVLVAYDIPHRDCGSYSAGGAGTSAQYHDWITRFAAGIRERPVVVIVEPDAVPAAVGGCSGANTAQRYAQLRDAIGVLKATGPGTAVYLDAGNPSWIRDTGALADGLRQAGVGAADGISLNVSNFVTTGDDIAYGRRLSDALGGTTHMVVDTGRNGAGPVGTAEIDGGPNWCNPPNRVLGKAPTTDTAQVRVDAYLWIKPPGGSDGSCRPGEPSAGKWWPEYALAMAARSA